MANWPIPNEPSSRSGLSNGAMICTSDTLARKMGGYANDGIKREAS
jgi:hypothetical protein